MMLSSRMTSMIRKAWSRCILVVLVLLLVHRSVPSVIPSAVAFSQCSLLRHIGSQLPSSPSQRSRTDGDERFRIKSLGLTTTTVDHGQLAEAIQVAWETSETDGIVQLGLDLWKKDDWNVQDILSSSRKAVTTKGQLAGVLNAWIGSCCVLQHQDKDKGELQTLGAERAYQLLDCYDNYLEDLDPDIVTLSLVYTALMQPNLPEDYCVLGMEILQRAQKLSKKMGGSKRRKSLAASARKQQTRKSNEEIQKLYGIDILYESDDELIVNKPSGMVCFHKHTTTSGKLPRKKSGGDTSKLSLLDISLEAALLDANIPLSSLNTDGRGIVHRIDRGTSGALVLAKTDKRHAELITEFFLRRIKKEYIALVDLPPEGIADSGTVDVRVDGRPALSMYTVEDRFNNGTTARLRFETKTGRKHQIRVHCAHALHAPILGDMKYNNQEFRTNTKIKERFCLHAVGLSIPHLPKIDAPEPTWWEGYTQSST